VKQPSLARELAAEQRAFLGRNRSRWTSHLDTVRAFLGAGLAAADPRAPVLILGAGSGLEVPWRLAPPTAVGWDGDPWSRIRTCCRHRRWPPWVFEDLTGGMAALSDLAWRTARHPWSGQIRTTPAAYRRLVGLLGSLDPRPGPLRAWILQHRPGTILAANVMGQFGVAAHQILDRAFAGRAPWIPDPDLLDPLEQAIDAWTARAVRAFLQALLESGADLWLVHDRGVLFGSIPASLGPMAEPWTAQVRAAVPVEAADPLCGVDVLREIQARGRDHHQRWLWPVAPGQTHIMESIRIQAT
jgi:hypothetical protein